MSHVIVTRPFLTSSQFPSCDVTPKSCMHSLALLEGFEACTAITQTETFSKSHATSDDELHTRISCMRLPLPADTFPTLKLSLEETHTLEFAAEVIVKRTSEQYSAHLTLDNGVVDKRRWKEIKRCEDVRLYVERKPSAENASYSFRSSSATTECADVKSMATILTFGSIVGNLDDVMYGVLSPTTEEMQLKSTYTDDGFVDWKVLASIIKPSVDDPFRELSLKWIVWGHQKPVSAVVRTRDVVFIHSAGVAMTPNGERIGYRLYHSVDVPGARELDEFKIIRAHFSSCELFRQRSPNCVEVYARALMNPMGDVPATVTSVTLAEVPIRVFKHAQYAEMKKLTWMLRAHRQLQSKCGSSIESSTSSSDSSSSSSDSLCEVCSQSLTSGSLLPFVSSNEKHCQVCLATVCSRCRINKTIYMPTEIYKHLKSENMTFCTRCVLAALTASSYKLAVLDVIESVGEVVDYRDALRGCNE